MRIRLLGVLAAFAAFVLAAPLSAQAEFDVILTGGTVIDGNGVTRFRADVALKGDRIALVSRVPIAATRSARVIDVSGKVVAPGFIDVHAHIDPLPRLPGAESAVRQGVTTAVGGPDGGSPLPLAPYVAAREADGIGINVAYLVGHNTIRDSVMGMANRAPTDAELERMKALVAEAMGQGALGLSTGLRYLPGTFAKTGEVVALSRVAADSGGIYTSHLREEGLGLIDGVAEAITIGRDARIPVVLTHHKAIGPRMWGASRRTLAMVDSARREGVDVMMDVYPYTATSTGLSILIPTWAFAGGDTAFTRRLADPTLRDSIKRGIVFNILNDRGGGDIARIQFSNVRWQPELNGKTLADWARQRGQPETPNVGAELVLEAQLKGGASMIYHVLDEADVRRIMQHPQAMIGSDGRLSRLGEGSPHPRAYGTFPRILGHYSRDLELFSLETAIHKMTGQSVARFRLPDRGVLRAGAFADIVVFDPATVADKSTFAHPHQYPVGIEHVFVNGVAAVDGGKFTDARSGRILKRGR